MLSCKILLRENSCFDQLSIAFYRADVERERESDGEGRGMERERRRGSGIKKVRKSGVREGEEKGGKGTVCD